ncbi:NACHT domain-containing protein [Streptomyces sp.]|uniref:NACHT domain-containing protein n=1 Tax=Streptomyces sp. TaxID=1931 RepID=UPI002D665735|nr:NACHT domain-containing protein [Streptomyces sp.]HZF89241.1 NACHT domain-containing protein [Streptomyces sp.]
MARRVPLARRWHLRKTPATYLRIFASIGAVAFLVWIGLALSVIAGPGPRFVENTCRETPFSCGAVTSFVTPFLALGLSAVTFLTLQHFRTVRRVRRTAKRRPRDLVPTAGSIIDEVVGRKELCSVIAQALRSRRWRRPYVLVGGVGSGKTAVLVQLTQVLAEKGALPVPVHLRRADLDNGEFNFSELAKKRFCDQVDPGVLSRTQAERVWRQLCMDDKAVIIADGLEEAFSDDERQAERDGLIRQAIARAEQQGIPLVIASRPHAALEGTRAAVIDLEPLSDEAALTYLAQQTPGADDRRLDWIVETAAVAESPLYLQLARQLRGHQLLENFESAKAWELIDTRGSDRAGIRVRLLNAWVKAIVDGHLRAQFGIPQEERRRTIAVISALACVGLLKDRQEVSFDELIDWRGDGDGTGEPEIRYPGILGELRRRARALPGLGASEACWRTVLSRCAEHGEELGLVEAHSRKVRFPHSIIQAYLGSAFLDSVQRDSRAALETALSDPGRELLMAFIMRSRADRSVPQRPTVDLLVKAAATRQDDKAFDLYATALEIDTGTIDDSAHSSIANKLLQRWPELRDGDARTLDEAKLRLVHRFGEAARRLDRASGSPDATRFVRPAYGELMRISWKEPGYPVRLAIAQEIGAGGDNAFDALRQLFPWPKKKQEPGPDHYDPWEQYKKAMADLKYEEGLEREVKLIPLPAAQSPRQTGKRTSVEVWREFVTRAWLVPMVVGSVGADRRVVARERLDLWLQHLVPNAVTGKADLPISLEIALAQGFKGAANRRRRHPATSGETRAFLIEQAERMLTHARYWYSQLTLIHALCLWELPDNGDEAGAEGRGAGNAGQVAGTEPLRAVERWLSMAGSAQALGDRPPDEAAAERGRRLHPFVAEAGDLAALALQTGHPERFIWIDERGATLKIGSSPADPTVHRKHNLWIPPSHGWSTLHPRAQQLLADVLLLLNLTERDGRMVDERLQRTSRTELPPCLRTDRKVLHPERTVGMPSTAEPGTSCLRGCKFELCPYPAKGEQPGGELREPFCRQQQALVSRHSLRRRRAGWQGISHRELARFWGAMAERTRTPSQEDATDTGNRVPSGRRRGFRRR